MPDAGADLRLREGYQRGSWHCPKNTVDDVLEQGMNDASKEDASKEEQTPQDEAAAEKESEEIIVRGTFDTYEENEQLFCTIRNAQLESL